MNYLVVTPLILVILFLQWRRARPLTWTVAWLVVIYVFLQHGFQVPIPQSVIWLYMAVVTGSLFLYVTADEERLKAVKQPLIEFAAHPRYSVPLLVVILAVPSLVAASVYFRMTAPVRAPFFARTIHPANPDQIRVHDSVFMLNTLNNPLRLLETTNPEQFRRHLEQGRDTYYKNCFYCHGDNMSGNGLFAQGLNPIPTNFADAGTIPQLTESYLFWRISKGGPGLPSEGAPWDSSMPAWENFLTDEEMWEVILFLYDFTGFRPRALEVMH